MKSHSPSWIRSARIAAMSLLAAYLLAGASTSQAADIWEYCYDGECFDDIKDAEAEMRADHPRGDLLKKKSTRLIGENTATPKTVLTYYVPDQPKESETTPPYYSLGTGQSLVCEPSDGPSGHEACRDEASMIENMYQYMKSVYPECGITPYTISGVFATPFYQIDSGRIFYSLPYTNPQAKRFEYQFNCGGGPGTHTWYISKWTFPTCPAGFSLRAGFSPTHAQPGLEPVDPSQMCRSNLAEPQITSNALHLVKCEAGNCNPTFPGSGDKFRAEADLVFAGRTFSRYYHSSDQSSRLPSLPEGWRHSYSDQILPITSYYDIPVVDDRGNYDIFRYMPNGLYRSETDPNRIFTAVDGVYRVIEADGTVKDFTSQGVLQKVYHPEDPGSLVTLAYDTLGRLSSVTDAKGRVLTLTYNGLGQLAAVSTTGGDEVLYGYDGSGRLQRVTRADASERTYLYDEAGLSAANRPHLLTGIVDENGDRYASFGYDARGRVVLSQLHTGSPAFPTHDRTELTYTGADTVTVTRGTGDTAEYSFTSNFLRRTTSVQDGRGATSKAYDALNRLAQTTDAAGSITQYGYADTYLNQVTEGVGTPEERRTLIERGPFQRTLSTTLQRKDGGAFVTSAVSRSAVGADGRTTAVCSVDPSSPNAGYVCGSAADAPAGVRQVSFQRCTSTDVATPNSTCPILGQLKSIDGPLPGTADTTTYLYRSADNLTGCGSIGPCHRKGDLHQVIAPGGLATTYAHYDLAGRPARIVDANGVATDLEYNARGWLTARIVRGIEDDLEVDDAFTRIEYDNVGQVTKVTQPDGAYLEFSYDAAHRLTGIEDNLGNTVTYQLDGAGNRISEETRDAANVLTHSLSRVYDQLGQLETLADALSTPTDFTYDAAGQVDTVTDAFNRTTDHDYDPLGRLKRSIANVNGTGPERAETRFQYDALDNLTAVIDPKGLTTSYGYNGLGDVVELDSPDTGSTTYTYDEAGNRASQTDARGITSLYGYDALGRLTGIDRPSPGQDVVFTHDAVPASCTAGETFGAGRLGTMTDASGSTQYCYDRRGNLVRKVQAVNLTATTRTVGYTYNAADRLVAMTYPSGAVVTYLRDATGRITGVTAQPSAGATPVTLVSDVDYLPFGPATRFTFGNGRALDKTYDANYGIDTITDSAVDGVDLGYTLDAMGKVTGLAERTATGATANRTVGYDGLDRLTSLNNGATLVQGFSYDATGNRTAKTTGAGTANYVYPTDSHRASHAGNTRTYDAAGNGLTIGGRTFTYDDAGRRVQHFISGTLVREYRYNGRGERVARIITPSPVNDQIVVYDEAGRLIGEYLKNGTRLREIVWLDDVPVAVLGNHGGSTHQYVLTDHLGTPRAIVHPASNAILWRWDLTPSAFGDHAAQTDPDGNGTAYTFNLRYPGQYYDEDTGLHYNYFRDYDPTTGRYLQSDPIGLAGGASTYGYVGGDPLSFVDLFGLKKVVLFHSDDLDYLRAIDTYRDDPSVCQVFAHGTKFGLSDLRRGRRKGEAVNYYNATKLADFLLASGCTKDMRVELNSCSAADGEDSIASQLAQLGVFKSVRGGTTTVWYDENPGGLGPTMLFEKVDPTVFPGVPDRSRPGEWVTLP